MPDVNFSMKRALVVAAQGILLNSSGVHERQHSSYDCETLLIWGKNDPVLSIDDHAIPLEKALAPVQLIQIPQCGHAPREEQPDKVNKLIASFLENGLKV